MTLRNFQVCTINTTFRDESLAPYIILEFLRLLSSEANYLFWKIFEALNTFLDGPRQKHSFSKQLMTVASSLGQIHQALKSFDSGLEDGSIPVSRFGRNEEKLTSQATPRHGSSLFIARCT